MDILALHRQGYSYRAISRKLAIHRNTVKNTRGEGKRVPEASSNFQYEIMFGGHSARAAYTEKKIK